MKTVTIKNDLATIFSGDSCSILIVAFLVDSKMLLIKNGRIE